MPENVDIAQLPADQGANQPASGTQGDVVALETLQDGFPSPLPDGAGGVPIEGDGQGNAPLPLAGTQQAPLDPAGVPSPLLAPGTGIGNAPPATQSIQPALNGEQDRIRVLDMLTTDPGVSEETREWAELLMKAMLS